MFKDRIQISVPAPCHENWEEMTPTERGRFCGSCQKNVIDFSLLSDKEIIRQINNNSNLCGRFNTSQLDRDLIDPKPKSSIWLATTSAVISFIGLGSQEVLAQKGKVVQTVQTDRKIVGDTTKLLNQPKQFHGIIRDNSGPLPGTTIVVKGTTNAAYSDLDGKFTIIAKEGDILVFSFLGLQTEELFITDKTQTNLDIHMIEMPMEKLGEMVVTVGGITAKRRTFFGRIFHSIGNWFR